MNKIMVLCENDNVAVALADISMGEEITSGVTAKQEIPTGHKVALTRIGVGEDVIKYGHPIGKSLQVIETGEIVHVHNLRSGLEERQNYSYNPGSIIEKSRFL